MWVGLILVALGIRLGVHNAQSHTTRKPWILTADIRSEEQHKRADAHDCGYFAVIGGLGMMLLPAALPESLNPCLGDLVQAANLAALVVASPAVISRAAERRVWRVRSIQSRGRFGRDHLTGFAL